MPYDGRQKGSGRNTPEQNFNEKSGNYSPSARYLYGGNSQQQNVHSPGQGQGPSRSHGKRESQSQQFDRLAKQNDIIIRLLKEIRDRLPAGKPQPGQGKKRKHRNRNDRHQNADGQQMHDQTDDQASYQADEQSAEQMADGNQQVQAQTQTQEQPVDGNRQVETQEQAAVVVEEVAAAAPEQAEPGEVERQEA